jgi:hypothetical protein
MLESNHINVQAGINSHHVLITASLVGLEYRLTSRPRIVV